MDNSLAPNDPYNNMQTAQDDTRPDFLDEYKDKNKEKKEKARKAALKAAEVAASFMGAPAGAGMGENAKNGVMSANKAGSGDMIGATKQAEESPEGFRFTGFGKNKTTEKKGFDIKKMSAGGVLGIILLGIVLLVSTLGGFNIEIAGIDFNLMKTVGFTPTVAFLNRVASWVTKNYLAEGRMPDKYAGRLAEQGLMVGQVLANGDFVRTNAYVSDVGRLADLAVLGNFQLMPSEGQLAMLYNGDVITADDFVARVESDPMFYAKVTEAEDIGALYYYSDDVNEAFKEMGVSRSMFADWVDTGDYKKNEENFLKELEKGINDGSDLTVNGFFSSSDETESENNSFTKNISEDDDANDIVGNIANDTKADSEDEATAKASQLLNTVVSASEPYYAAKSFMALEEPIQRARIKGEGPIHELMNTIRRETEVEYKNILEDETEKTKASVMTTTNFVAAVSGGKFSKEEALNFSRDRILTAMKAGKSGNIKDTTVDSKGHKESDIVISIGNAFSADEDALDAVEDSVDKAMIQKNSDLFPSIVGGNRIVEGGAFISNTINRKAIGAMGADSEEIARYHQEVIAELERKASAERASRSPFDISSPYTFMGSIVYGFANSALRSNAGNGNSAGAVIGAIAGLTSDSTKDLFETAIADGDDDSYEMTHGEHCDTVNSAYNIEGDIYCTAKQILVPDYIERTNKEWEDAIDEDIYELFVTIAMDREATVGVNDAGSCEKWREEYNIPIVSSLSELLGLYNVCKANPVEGFFSDELALVDKVGTGEYFSVTDGNDNKDIVKEYSAYATYDQVSSLLEDRDSKAAMIREKYYAKHPKDNSREGIIARRSGLTKNEAKIALAYADYLVEIARYNPATRYAFGGVLIEKPEEPLVEHANKVSVDLYALWHGRTEYDDLRGRIRVG